VLCAVACRCELVIRHKVRWADLALINSTSDTA
jgi:hypothetical protein